MCFLLLAKDVKGLFILEIDGEGLITIKGLTEEYV